MGERMGIRTVPVAHIRVPWTDSILESRRRRVPSKPGLLGQRAGTAFRSSRPEDFSLSGFMFQFYRSHHLGHCPSLKAAVTVETEINGFQPNCEPLRRIASLPHAFH